MKPIMLGLVLGLFATAAAAGVCGPREKVLAGLVKMHDEVRVAMGLLSRNAVIEVYASPKGTFTIVETRSSGISCVVLSGNDFTTFEIKPPSF